MGIVYHQPRITNYGLRFFDKNTFIWHTALMLKHAKDFIKTYIAIINWTIGYLFIYYVIFRVLFGFDALESHDWQALSSAHLTGVTGLAFAVLLSAFIPLYLASVFIIKRTKKIPIDMPKAITVKKKKAEAFKKSDIPLEKVEEPEVPLPNALPNELRAPYIQMVRGTLAKNSIDTPISRASAAVNLEPAPTPAARSGFESPKIENISSAMAIPDDFDVSTTSAAPSFKTVGFDESEDKKNNPYEKQLFDLGYKIRHDKDIIVARKSGTNYAIAVHDDGDAWVVDEDNWFANGKQKESPIKALKDAANRNGATAVLLLVSSNIVDLEKHREKWIADDIRVIENLAELNKE
jgi:hypothetical protein